MKNSLYIISGVLIVIWAYLYWGLNTSGSIHILLVLAGFIILVRIALSKQLAKK